jgi:hypothetical protein
MRSFTQALLISCVVLLGWSFHADAKTASPDDSTAWPPATRECRPWSYWWWHGSAVDRENLSKEMRRYRDAGWGGLHIIPIYGVKGSESRNIPYLSPAWFDILRYTVEEAGQLDMGIDMTTGTGWCFGGPAVTEQEATARCVVEKCTVAAGEELPKKFLGKIDSQRVQTIMAFSAEGKNVDLTSRFRSDGVIDWKPEQGDWTVYAVSQRPSMRVKRAAPGGEGFMLNPFFAPAMQHYLAGFEDAFNQYDGPKPRAMYHDSFEYDANWSPDLFEQFHKRRGYRLEEELPALFAEKSDDHSARVKSDYRETISDAMIEDAMPLWTRWAAKHGFQTRNQAHGSPANLLDLYALADIPETEMFHTLRSHIVSKFASSAAHVAGRKLVAAETGTWLKEHFTETLADLKYLVDDMFLSGVNHVVFHGSCYSPDDTAWPGWLFYASTELNPRNSIWRDVPALADYIARCQSILQSGTPDNDFLIYWPIHDTWHSASGMQIGFSIHGTKWCQGMPVGQLAERLWKRGFAFDFISDRQLAESTAKGGRIFTPGGEYHAVVIPACRHLPLETARQLLALAKSGATVIFEDEIPQDVPGWKDFERRRAELREMTASIALADASSDNVKQAELEKGRVWVGQVETALAKCGIARETLADHSGMLCIRRRFEGGNYYFIANRGDRLFEDWISPTVPIASAVLMDPMTGKTGTVSLRNAETDRPEIFLRLSPGESLIVRTFSEIQATGTAWQWWTTTGEKLPIAGTWEVQFLSGGPQLPSPTKIDRLTSWTAFGERGQSRETEAATDYESFAGTARYALTFDAPSTEAKSWILDLGDVRASARVRLNGRDCGTLIISPFQTRVDSLKPHGNILEVEVTGVSANRIRDLDRRKIPWKIFHDINFANINYKPFDASNWPLTDCGLLGPVTLTANE